MPPHNALGINRPVALFSLLCLSLGLSSCSGTTSLSALPEHARQARLNTGEAQWRCQDTGEKQWYCSTVDGNTDRDASEVPMGESIANMTSPVLNSTDKPDVEVSSSAAANISTAPQNHPGYSYPLADSPMPDSPLSEALDNSDEAITAEANNPLAHYPDHYYAVQLLAAKKAETVQRFLRSHPQLDSNALIQLQTRDWQLLLLGIYPNYAEARAAIADAPAFSSIPWIRPLGPLKHQAEY